MLMTSRCEVGNATSKVRRILALRNALDHDGHATRQPIGVAFGAAGGHQQAGFDLAAARPPRTWVACAR